MGAAGGADRAPTWAGSSAPALGALAGALVAIPVGGAIQVISREVWAHTRATRTEGQEVGGRGGVRGRQCLRGRGGGDPGGRRRSRPGDADAPPAGGIGDRTGADRGNGPDPPRTTLNTGGASRSRKLPRCASWSSCPPTTSPRTSIGCSGVIRECAARRHRAGGRRRQPRRHGRPGRVAGQGAGPDRAPPPQRQVGARAAPTGPASGGASTTSTTPASRWTPTSPTTPRPCPTWWPRWRTGCELVVGSRYVAGRHHPQLGVAPTADLPRRQRLRLDPAGSRRARLHLRVPGLRRLACSAGSPSTGSGPTGTGSRSR